MSVVLLQLGNPAHASMSHKSSATDSMRLQAAGKRSALLHELAQVSVSCSTMW